MMAAANRTALSTSFTENVKAPETRATKERIKQ